MADPVTMLMLGSTALSAATTIAGGHQADEMGKMQQAQAEARAKEETATAQRAAAGEDRKRQLAQSALVTQAGASGSGASDVTVENLARGIEEEGIYNTRAVMAEGNSRAQASRYAGALARWQGKQAKRASYFEAAGTLMGGAMKTPMMKRYGTTSAGVGTGYSY